jgi:hypothetical protein
MHFFSDYDLRGEGLYFLSPKMYMRKTYVQNVLQQGSGGDGSEEET